MKKEINTNEFSQLVKNIKALVEQSRQKAVYNVNQILVKTNWEIGRYIVEYEQKGKQTAKYGAQLLDTLARELTKALGRGFSRSQIANIRLFYVVYRNVQTLSGQLSWSHYVELIGISDELERGFYEKQCIEENWSVRELKRQKESALFLRLAHSKDKAGILELAKKGQVIETEIDIVKDPYILEFLKIPEDHRHTERELEAKIIDQLQNFLLELGKGFAFIARQYRITLDNIHFYVDLLFYHRILKCFVLIDLKVDKVKHTDIGQMNMYLNYFQKEENTEGDNPPIGIILTADKNHILVEYATGGITNKLFVSKYQTYLPNKKELEQKVRDLIDG